MAGYLRKVRSLTGFLGWLKYKLWRLKTILLTPFKAHIDTLYDENYFLDSYLRFEGRTHTFPSKFVQVLFKRFKPASVADIGCGVGTYLHYFQEKGCDILGVEGSRDAISLALIPGEKIIEHDLRKPLALGKKFDLTIFSEVAEHLPNKSTKVFLETVASSSDTIVFSSSYGAPKEYIYHCNEKPPAEWIRLYKGKGFELDRKTTSQLRKELAGAGDALAELVINHLMVFRRNRKTTSEPKP